MFGRIKRWWRQCRRNRPTIIQQELKDEELQKAMREHLVSSRLVRIASNRSAKALRQLNELLELRARALEGIAAADAALKILDEAKDHDQ